MKSEAKIPFFLINRYLLRGNKWKLFLIIFLMAAAFINLVFVTSLFGGIIEMTNRQIINTYTGNIMIAPKEGSDFIEDLDSKLKKIDQINEVLARSAQVSVPASLESRNIKRSWPILVINPDDEKRLTNISEKIIEGEYLAQDDVDKIIIGRQIAGGDGVEMNAFSFRGAKVGDKVTMAFDGVSKEYTVKGIFYSKFLDTDERAFITEKSLKELVPDFYDNKASSIILKTAKGNEDRTIELLKEMGLSENFYTWEDVAGLMKTVTESFLSINILLSTVGVLIAAFTIFIVIYIDIVSKRQQIGILRAIGIKPYLINALYVMQTVVYSCFGVILGGIIFFGILVPYFNHYPFSLPIGDATLVINYGELIIRTETIIIVAILAGLIPAVTTTKMKLLEAIWGR